MAIVANFVFFVPADNHLIRVLFQQQNCPLRNLTLRNSSRGDVGGDHFTCRCNRLNNLNHTLRFALKHLYTIITTPLTAN